MTSSNGSSSSEITLVVNPKSRVARRGLVPDIERALRSQGYDVQRAESANAKHLMQLVCHAGAGALVGALGGDGTISLAARAAHASGAILFPLPGGRGNDFCSWVGIGTDPVAAVGRMSSFTAQPVDAATANGELFLGVATIGFDSLANGYANEMRIVSGPAVYLAGALKALAKWKGAQFALTIDGRQIEAEGFSIVVGNSGQYGGGLRILPRAQIDDGLLDVLVGGSVSRSEFVKLLPKIRSGEHLQHPAVQYFTGRRIDIAVPTLANRKIADRIALYADGDRIADPPVTIEVVPAALRLLAPVRAKDATRPTP